MQRFFSDLSPFSIPRLSAYPIFLPKQSVEEFHRISTSIKEAEEVIRTETLRPERVLPFLVPGRLVRVREGGKDWGWGVALCVSHRPPGQANPKGGAPLPLSTDPSSYYIVDTLLLVNKGSLQAGRFEPAAEGAADTSVDVAILPVQLSLITNLSAVVINLPESLQSAEARWSAALLLKEVKRRFTQGIPPLDPSEDMGIVDPKLEAAVRAVEELEPKLLAHPLFAKEAQQEWYKLYLDKADLKNQAQQASAPQSHQCTVHSGLCSLLCMTVARGSGVSGLRRRFPACLGREHARTHARSFVASL